MLEQKTIDRLAKLVDLSMRGSKREAEVAKSRMHELVEAVHAAVEDAKAARTVQPSIEKEIALIDRIIESHHVLLVIATRLVELGTVKVTGEDDPLIATVEEQMEVAREKMAAIEEGLRIRERITSGEFNPLLRYK